MYVILSGEVEVHLQGAVIDTLAQGATAQERHCGRQDQFRGGCHQ